MVHIAVAGAGIGGLVAALALARSGAQVTVLERRPTPAEFGAGLQLSPNATRVLAELDLLDAIRSASLEPRCVRVRRGRDAADLVRFPLGPNAIQRYGAPFLLILRPALQRILVERAEGDPRVDLRFASEVLGASPVGRTGARVETSGGPLAVDGFVDARGVGVAPGRPSGRVAWRALVTAERQSADECHADTNLWLGRRAHLVHYPLPGGERINVVAVIEGSTDQDPGGDDLWSKSGDPAVLHRAFAAWHDDALRLLDPQAEWRCWPLLDAAPLPRWSQGPLTRLGDAAHPMLPFLAQGASQAIEDAGCLARSLRENSDVSTAFARYEQRRLGRATRVQAASRRQADIYHLARPASDARDLTMRLMGGSRALARMDWLYGSADTPWPITKSLRREDRNGHG